MDGDLIIIIVSLGLMLLVQLSKIFLVPILKRRDAGSNALVAYETESRSVWVAELTEIVNRCHNALVKEGAAGFGPWLSAVSETINVNETIGLEDAIMAAAAAIARTRDEIKAGAGWHSLDPLREAAEKLNSFELKYLSGAGD